MAKVKPYKISTLPRHKQQKRVVGKVFKNHRKQKLIASIMGIYLVLGGLIGYVTLKTTNLDHAKADEIALITTSIKLIDEKEYKLGDKVSLALTMQNTSSVEAINSLSLEMNSTKDSIKWTEANNDAQKEYISSENNTFKMPILSSGERAEYIVSGILKDNQIGYLNIIGKLIYKNKKGSRQTETNKIYTKLKPAAPDSNKLLNLKSDKAKFNQNEPIVLNLEKQSSHKNAGKVYVTNKNSQEVVDAIDCKLEDSNLCEVKPRISQPGFYSALFIDDSESNYSEIFEFEVAGKNADFVPSNQSTLDLPFATDSINGIVPIIAKRVISLNQSINNSYKCTFDISKEGKIITSVEVPIESDRTCKTDLSYSNFKSEGIFKISLKNSPAQKEVLFTQKSQSLLNLEKKNSTLEKNKAVDIEIQNIKAKDSDQALNDKKATIGIWQTNQNQYQEYSSLNNESLKVINGTLTTKIPADYFKSGGLYMVYIKTEDGQQSDFLALNFENKNLGFTDSGIIIDDSSLTIGQDLSFKIQGIRDRNNNLISQSECSSEIYQTGSSIPIIAKGQIKNGECSISIPSNKITKAGPGLITMSGSTIENKLSLSKQVYFRPGNSIDFGNINLEYQPARKNFANKAIVGPFTDKFGNLANYYNLKLVLINSDKSTREIPNVSVNSGFATVAIPASFLDSDKVELKLVNEENKEILQKKLDVSNSEDKLILPIFPSKLNSNENLKVSLSDLVSANLSECKLSFIKTQNQFIEETSQYNSKEGKCSFDWEINKFRDNKKALVQLTLGQNIFNQIVDLTSDTPANLFSVFPQTKLNSSDELDISLSTSVIVDKQGLPVEIGNLNWQYNGKLIQVPIVNGLSELNLLAKNLNTKDINTSENERYLDLDLDIKASPISISKTNNLNIYLGEKDIANNVIGFDIIRGANQITKNSNTIFQFKSEVCKAKLVNNLQESVSLRTHWQGNKCYVQAVGKEGDNSIVFEDKGFTLGTFNYSTNPESMDISWCQDEGKCMIQVLSLINGVVEATVKDGDNEYKFRGKELENTVEINQNGLNPLKNYKVYVKYTNSFDKEVIQYAEISGEKLQTS